MSREYRHLQQYEKEILRLREEGLTHREIAEKFGLTKEHNIYIYNNERIQLKTKLTPLEKRNQFVA